MIALAWRNMWRDWRRTTIALGAIALGVALLLLFDGLLHGSDQAIFGNAIRLYGGNLQIHAPGYRERVARIPLLPLADAAHVRSTAGSLPGVVAAAPRIHTSGMLSHRGETLAVQIIASDPAIEAPLSLQAASVAAGRFLAAGERGGIVIGRAAAERLGAAVGDMLDVIGRRRDDTVRQHRMDVVGIYDLGIADLERSLVYIGLDDAQQLYNLRGQATEIVVFLGTVGGEAALMRRLQAQLPGYEVDTWQTLRPEIRQAIESKMAATSAFGGIVLAIASIGILNLMLMAAFERTREMGVLAALGMRGSRITLLFITEGALIGGVGALIGATIGGLLVGLLGAVGIDLSMAAGMGEISALMGDRLRPTISITDVLGRMLLVIVIAALAACWPAWQAGRREPSAALRHV
jgi:ABC-type lipoprotein release transport system permease subunit